jgi:hypothetical protein
MAPDTSAHPSRRALLAGAIGGLAAWAASAVDRISPARATNGDTVTVGGTFTGSQPTSITNTAGDGIVAQNSSTAASGLFAHATAASGTTYGVFGRSNSTAGTGVAGVDYATSGANTGVYGEARGGNGSSGVHGVYNGGSSLGIGVFGVGTTIGSFGVVGSSGSGVAVQGQTATGVGLRGYSSGSGPALRVDGRATFSRSGRASVAANKSHVDVTPSGGLASSANVLATLQRKRSGVYVAAVRINYPTAGKARIYLNKVASTTKSTPVAWFVLG